MFIYFQPHLQPPPSVFKGHAEGITKLNQKQKKKFLYRLKFENLFSDSGVEQKKSLLEPTTSGRAGTIPTQAIYPCWRSAYFVNIFVWVPVRTPVLLLTAKDRTLTTKRPG